MSTDEQFMQIAFEQAAMGRGAVEPNPMVGAVLVRDGIEIARGHHEKFGGLHAEPNAIAAARSVGASHKGATLYVTLEPCCHRNKKTPPCTDAIISAGISRVVAAMADPDVNVAGRGFETLRRAGIQVEVGLCEQQARDLLRAYIKLRTQRRPWVICKWAQTSDGYISLPPGQGQWISTDRSRGLVHEIRSYSSGILAGVGTVIADDPQLTNRSGHGRQPTRLVLDSQLRTPLHSKVVQSAKQSPVLIVTGLGAAHDFPQRAGELLQAGCKIIEIVKDENGMLDLQSLLDELGRQQWTYLLVEGGAEIHRSFISQRLADEIIVFISQRNLHDEVSDSTILEKLPRLDATSLDDLSKDYCLIKECRIESDLVLEYASKKNG